MAYFQAKDLLAGRTGGITAVRTPLTFADDTAAATYLVDQASATHPPYDVFLSHAYLDARLIAAVRDLMQRSGLKPYVDWIDDGNTLDRHKVSRDTADLLRKRMIQSTLLVFAISRKSSSSKWMPWELGYFDGLNKPIFVLPVEETGEPSYQGQEYLGLYQAVESVQGIPKVRVGQKMVSLKSLATS